MWVSVLCVTCECVCIVCIVCVCVRGVEMWRVHTSRARTPPDEVYDGELAVENIHSTEHLEGNQLCDRETSSRPRHGPTSDADVARKWPFARLSRKNGNKKKRRREKQIRENVSLADDDALDPSNIKHQRNGKLGDRQRERETKNKEVREKKENGAKDRERERMCACVRVCMCVCV